MIIKISLPHPCPRPDIPRKSGTKTMKIKQLEPVCPVNQEQRTRTFPNSAFQIPNVSRIKHDYSHGTARQVPHEHQTHGQVVLKVTIGRAQLLGGHFPLCPAEPVRVARPQREASWTPSLGSVRPTLRCCGSCVCCLSSPAASCPAVS